MLNVAVRGGWNLVRGGGGPQPLRNRFRTKQQVFGSFANSRYHNSFGSWCKIIPDHSFFFPFLYCLTATPQWMYSPAQTNPVLLKKNMHQFRRINSFFAHVEWGLKIPWARNAAASRKCCIWDALPEGAGNFARKLIKLGKWSFVSKPKTIRLCICFDDPLTKSRNPLAGKAQL